MEEQANTAAPARRGFSGWQVTGIVVVAVLITAVGTALLVRAYLFPREFRPVELSAAEEQRLQSKIDLVSGGQGPRITDAPAGSESDADWLRPEAYSEQGGRRAVEFTEKEVNGLIGNDPQLARRLALDFSDDLASARLLIPLDPDFPVLGGRTLRVNAGVSLAYRDGRPIVVLKGVSIMGVPVPSAWLGNLKNVDLVREFGGSEGFWKAFADGVESIEVRDGRLRVALKE